MFAAIDIGTNTVLLLIAEYNGNELKVIHEEQRIPRLGRGVDKNRNLDPESVDRVIQALWEYRRVIDHDYPDVDQSIVMATSAVRDSSNREAFKTRIQQETGFDVRILSGLEEAEWTYLGARSVLNIKNGVKAITLDIGGGSTEASLGVDEELLDFHSFDIGSVRYTERFIHSDPPTSSEIENCRNAIREAFDDHPFSWEGESVAIGVAGTVTSLAYMEAELTNYEPRKLNGMGMTQNRVTYWVDKLSGLSSAELLHMYPVVMEGRADVFLPGILILDEFLKRYDFKQFIVSTGGIRHGGVLKMYEELKKKKGAG